MHKIPVEGLVLLLGVDRFLNEARAVTNLIGNGVATVVVARWEGQLDMEIARAMLDRKTTVDVDDLATRDYPEAEHALAKQPAVRSNAH
jgi:DAACS family dicarboxylate/amino acid:cation (Na+ or H+) symporter/aerobic C4-dicarboxylate transport protein